MRKLFRKRTTEYKHSLRQETMRLFVSILCILALLYLVASLFISRRTDNDYRTNTSEAAVNNVASYIANCVDTYNYISRLIMVNPRVVSFLHAENAESASYEARMGMYEVLNMYNSISYIESVYIFRNDKQYANTGKSEYRIDTSADEWQRVMDARGSKVIAVDGNGMMIKNYGEPTLTFSRAIYDTNSQKLLGMLVMNISNECFDEVLNFQERSNICILDADGSYLCGDSGMAEFFRDDYENDVVSRRKINYMGRKVSLAGRKAVNSLIILGCTRYGSKVIPQETVITLGIIFITFLASTVISAGFIRKKITGPIMTLDGAMDRTKSSGWIERIDADMPDNEIGHLAETYNQTLDYLNELFQRLLKEEENIRMAELRVLQEQIKPHFLYNTLETIGYIAVEERAERAHAALETLGSFYRNSLSKGEREVPFRRELAITKDYLSLQKLRYGSSFDEEYEIDDDTLDVKVPKLILQPMVENSIYHGVRLKGEKCIIRVSARNTEEGLLIVVYDTGVGMNQEQIDKLLGKDSGMCQPDAAPDDGNPQDVRDIAQRPEKEQTGTHRNIPGSGFGLVGTIERIRYYCNRNDVVKITSEEGEYTKIEILISREMRD